MSNEPSAFSDNPYQAPQTEIGVEVVADSSLAEAERIRRAHIKHEASLKTIGWLYLLNSIGFLAVGPALLISSNVRDDVLTGLGPLEWIIVIGVGGLFGGTALAAGIGLLQLAPWSRWPAAILASIGLLSIPVGTLVGIYFLYLLLCAKSRVVFSPAYRDIMAQTPHVKYKSILRTVIFVLLIVLAVLFIVSMIAGIAGVVAGA